MTHIILDNHHMLTVRRELVVNRPSVSSVVGATMPFMTKDKRNLVDTLSGSPQRWVLQSGLCLTLQSEPYYSLVNDPHHPYDNQSMLTAWRTIGRHHVWVKGSRLHPVLIVVTIGQLGVLGDHVIHDKRQQASSTHLGKSGCVTRVTRGIVPIYLDTILPGRTYKWIIYREYL